MCCGSCHLRNDASPHFFTEGASQDLSLHQIPGAEQLGKPRVHLRVPSTGSREDGEPQRPPAGPRAPSGRIIKQRRCVAARLVYVPCKSSSRELPTACTTSGEGSFLPQETDARDPSCKGRGRGMGLEGEAPDGPAPASAAQGRSTKLQCRWEPQCRSPRKALPLAEKRREAGLSARPWALSHFLGSAGQHRGLGAILARRCPFSLELLHAGGGLPLRVPHWLCKGPPGSAR